ncbi:unnamed protein product [Prunus armeniaca]
MAYIPFLVKFHPPGSHFPVQQLILITCPYTPQQNGMVERKNRHVVETTLTLLTAANMPGQHVIHDESVWPFKSLLLSSTTAVSESQVAMPPILFPLPLQEVTPQATIVTPIAPSTSSSISASLVAQLLGGSESVLVP